jgi:molecular chaperone DnaK
MRQEAETYAEHDKRRLELIELKNQAENLFQTYGATLRDNRSLISDEFKLRADEKVVTMKAAFADPTISVETVNEMVNDFQQTLFAVGASVYEQASRNSQADDAKTPMPSDTMVDYDQDSTVKVDYEAIE